jgi:hypothetical protein
VKHRSIANQHGEVNLLCLDDDSTNQLIIIIVFTLIYTQSGTDFILCFLFVSASYNEGEAGSKYAAIIDAMYQESHVNVMVHKHISPHSL